MELSKAKDIADRIKAQLEPHCIKIEIAGSIRRKKQEVKDIELVAIPKPYEVGLFASGIALVVNQWVKVKGDLPCRYTQRILPDGIKLDLFFADECNWGLIYAIRTGSSKYSHEVLGKNWVKRGYKSEKGYLHYGKDKICVKTERELFHRIGIEYLEPEYRNI